jgi:hypothetical protein
MRRYVNKNLPPHDVHLIVAPHAIFKYSIFTSDRNLSQMCKTGGAIFNVNSFVFTTLSFRPYRKPTQSEIREIICQKEHQGQPFESRYEEATFYIFRHQFYKNLSERQKVVYICFKIRCN